MVRKWCSMLGIRETTGTMKQGVRGHPPQGYVHKRLQPGKPELCRGGMVGVQDYLIRQIKPSLKDFWKSLITGPGF